jgi:dipeptidyl aminopeptidase/acylaminoacyl peptidase
MAAVHELHKEDKVTVNLLGGTPEESPEVYRVASPMTYVSADSAPIFFIHGEEDTVVPIAPARKMSGRLRELGVDSPFLGIPGISHGVRLYVMGAGKDSPFPQILDFLATHLGDRK